MAIARALINNPQLLLLDEPTSTLDADNQKYFMNVLLNHREKHSATAIFVKYDLTLAKYFDRTVALTAFVDVLKSSGTPPSRIIMPSYCFMFYSERY